jgi:hypothetical protein
MHKMQDLWSGWKSRWRVYFRRPQRVQGRARGCGHGCQSLIDKWKRVAADVCDAARGTFLSSAALSPCLPLLFLSSSPSHHTSTPPPPLTPPAPSCRFSLPSLSLILPTSPPQVNILLPSSPMSQRCRHFPFPPSCGHLYTSNPFCYPSRPVLKRPTGERAPSD